MHCYRVIVFVVPSNNCTHYSRKQITYEKQPESHHFQGGLLFTELGQLGFPSDPFNQKDYPHWLNLKYVRLHYYILSPMRRGSCFPRRIPVFSLSGSQWVFKTEIVPKMTCFHKSFDRRGFFNQLFAYQQMMHLLEQLTLSLDKNVFRSHFKVTL